MGRIRPTSPAAGQARDRRTEAEAGPLVSVIVVNYNGGERIRACLSALAGDHSGPPSEIFIVDNASTDGSARLAEDCVADHPRMRVLHSEVNRGYAGGVNLALPSARGAYVAVLNMDVIVSPGWLAPLVDFLEASPGAGAACPLAVLDGDPALINAAGQQVNVTGLGFNRLLGKPRERAGTEPVQVSGLQGGAFVIRRSILDRLGGWDESGFLYQEDVQLSWLLALLDEEIHCVPRSVVRHDYQLTMYAEKLFLLERNRAAMVLANVRLPTRIALAPLFALTECLMWGYCLLRGTGFLRAKWRAYRWLLAHRREVVERRRFVESIRRRSDWQVLRSMSWGYAWDQFLTLGRERGPSRRMRIPLGEGEMARGQGPDRAGGAHDR